MSLLISIEGLLSGQIVEGTRMELKEGWNPKTIMRSVCAFANDFENEGSGYIVVGVKEKDGKPIRPVNGFNPKQLVLLYEVGLFNHFIIKTCGVSSISNTKTQNIQVSARKAL